MITRRVQWFILLGCSLVVFLVGAFGMMAVALTIGAAKLFTPPGLPTVGLVVLGVGGFIASAILSFRWRS